MKSAVNKAAFKQSWKIIKNDTMFDEEFKEFINQKIY